MVFGLALSCSCAVAVPASAAGASAASASRATSWQDSTLTTASTLKAGHSLLAGQRLVSPNGQYELLMRSNGNLVEYMQGHPLWASHTGGHSGAHVTMQRHGNLVVQATSGKVLWSSHTGGRPLAAYYLAVQSDAELVVYTPSNSALWASATVSDTLWANGTLKAGQYLTSANGQYQLIMQGDGNLVEYMQGHPLWASGTAGHSGAVAVMQADGNLVVYLGSTPLWASGTGGHAAAAYRLAVQPDANLVIYTPSNSALWASATVSDTLWANGTLTEGQYLHSPNGQYQLIMQGDGNLVVYSGGTAIWASSTAGHPGARAVMQGDGNLVVYLGSTALWASGTGGHAPAAFYLAMQSDGNLVIYTPAGVPLWASKRPSPSWWSGNCDVNNHPGSYPLGASYNGVQACGPGPLQGGYDYLVHFYSGAWGEYEWECVELVMRYMYLVYGINPYSANGNTVVSNYPGSLLTKIPNNGTSLPAPGDIVSEAGTTSNPNGHTGVVTAVNVTNGTGTVTIMEENATSTGWGSIPVSGNVLGSGVTGWLHHSG